MSNVALTVDVVSQNVDVEELRTDLSVFGESVEVRRSSAGPVAFLDPLLPAIVTIKKRQQEIEVARQIAELNAAGKEEEATETYILSRETVRDWTFV